MVTVNTKEELIFVLQIAPFLIILSDLQITSPTEDLIRCNLWYSNCVPYCCRKATISQNIIINCHTTSNQLMLSR